MLSTNGLSLSASVVTMRTLRAAGAYALSLLAFIVTASCGNSGDASPAAGTSGTGGTAGSGGSSLVGGAGGVQPILGGAGGTAGTGGDTGTGGTAGLGGTGGAVGGNGGTSAIPCTGTACDPPPSNRVTINLGQTPWKFGMQNPTGAETVAFNDSAWPDVGIPHTWNDMNSFVNNKSGGWTGPNNPETSSNNWYRKHFKVDAKYAGRKFFVEVGGAHVGARVFINGTFMKGNNPDNPNATHVVGFVPFIVDITDYVKTDGTTDNVLAVNVAKNANWFTGPGFSTVFRFGQDDGGLFRPVWMHITDKVHVPQNVYSVVNNWGTYVNTVSASAASAVVKVQTNVQNETGAAADVTLTVQIVDDTGNGVTTSDATKNVAAGTTAMFDQDITVPNPKLWFPAASTFGKPNMYKVYHIVKVGGTVVDAFTSPLGIRTLTWDKDFPYINGQKHYLWGVSSRYDYPALGTAVPDEIQWRDAKLCADGGGNLWRPGHSTSSREFVEACDQYGIMVVQPSGEGEGSFNMTAGTDYKGKLKAEIHRDMIVRDRNHPSILAWEANNGPMATPFAQELKALSKVWDSVQTRAQADRTPNSANGDILGCTLTGCEIGVKNKYPNNPAWGSEYWGKHGSRFAYDTEIALAAEFVNNLRKSRAANAFGIAQWYLMETPGEDAAFLEGTTPEQARTFGSSMMDVNRIPKLMYYAYSAAWNPFSVKPVVALAHHWNRTGTVRVNAFSNCPKVRLLVNGAAKGEKAPNPWNSDASKDIVGEPAYAATAQNTTLLPYQVSFDGVAWETGTVRVECLDASGAVVAFDEKKTAGAAAKIDLAVQNGLRKPDGKAFKITANGSDAALILAKVVDANGVWVPTANMPITWAVTGPGTYKGGSDQYVDVTKTAAWHGPGDPELLAEGGMCMVAVRSQFTTGTVTVTATSPGLAQGTATFQVEAIEGPSL
jgi:beta-galactosidase